ncbi:hypothetical protein GCM10025787_28710 [Saccharopolyspora rosea]
METSRGSGGLNQPWRAAVAGFELVGAVVLLLAAWWSWSRGSLTIALPGPAGGTDVVTRSIGSWLAVAVAAATAAGLLLINAVRQVALALRVRPRG